MRAPLATPAAPTNQTADEHCKPSTFEVLLLHPAVYLASGDVNDSGINLFDWWSEWTSEAQVCGTCTAACLPCHEQSALVTGSNDARMRLGPHPYRGQQSSRMTGPRHKRPKRLATAGAVRVWRGHWRCVLAVGPHLCPGRPARRGEPAAWAALELCPALVADGGGWVNTAQPAGLAACLSFGLASAWPQVNRFCRLAQGLLSHSRRVPRPSLPAPMQRRRTGLRRPSQTWMHSWGSTPPSRSSFMWRFEAGAPCQTMHVCVCFGQTCPHLRNDCRELESVALSGHLLHVLQLRDHRPGSFIKLNHHSCLLLVNPMTIERGPPCRHP